VQNKIAEDKKLKAQSDSNVVVSSKTTKPKVQGVDEMQEIFLPGDAKPSKATAMYDKSTGALVVNFDGETPE